MGCGGADFGEDGDVNGGVGLCVGGKDGLGGGELDGWCVTGSPGLVESSGRPPKQFPILSLFEQRCVFGQLEKKWSMWLRFLLMNMWRCRNV